MRDVTSVVIRLTSRKFTKEPKCFSCNEWGHMAPNCSKKKTSNSNSSSGSLNPKALKRVIMNGVKSTALVDTGRDINLMSLDLVRSLKIKDVQPTNIRNNGVGSTNVKSGGVVTLHIEIDGELFHTCMFLFDSNVLPIPLIIGIEVLNSAEVIIKGGEVTIRRLEGSWA